MSTRIWWLMGLAAVVTLAVAVPQAQRGGGAPRRRRRRSATPVAKADARVMKLKETVSADVQSMFDLGQQMVDMVFSFGELGFQEFETQRVPHRHPQEERLHHRDRLRRHSHGVGGALGVGQAGDRARLRRRLHPAGVAEAGRRLSRPDRRRRAGHGEGHNSGTPLNIVAALAVKQHDGAREAARHDPASGRASPRSWWAPRRTTCARACSRTSTSCSTTTSAPTCDVGWGDGGGNGLVSVEYTFHGETRAQRRRPVARPLGARRRRADERRLELPPRAPAPAAALALRHHQRRRPAQRRAAQRQRLVLLPRDQLRADQEASGRSATRWPRARR